MRITRLSMISGIYHTREIPISESEFNSLMKGPAKWYVPGKTIQEAFPMLTPGEREFLLTGMTEQEWDELFYEDQE